MILPGGKYHVYLATRPVDFRKGHAGLSLVVQTVLGHDPYSGAVFIFRSKRGDRAKILVWDQTGLVLVYKHLEGGSFHWPRPADGVIKLTPAQFSALFEGLDWKAVRAERRRRVVDRRHRGGARPRAEGGAGGGVAEGSLAGFLALRQRDRSSRHFMERPRRRACGRRTTRHTPVRRGQRVRLGMRPHATHR